MDALIADIRAQPSFAGLLRQNAALRAALAADPPDRDAVWRELYPVLQRLRGGDASALPAVDENDPEVQRLIFEQMKKERLSKQLADLQASKRAPRPGRRARVPRTHARAAAHVSPAHTPGPARTCPPHTRPGRREHTPQHPATPPQPPPNTPPPPNAPTTA